MHEVEWASANYLLLKVPENRQRATSHALDCHQALIDQIKLDAVRMGNVAKLHPEYQDRYNSWHKEIIAVIARAEKE